MIDKHLTIKEVTIYTIVGLTAGSLITVLVGKDLGIALYDLIRAAAVLGLFSTFLYWKKPTY